MMTCKELTELVTDYLEGRMSLWRRVQFQLHLGMCGHCRAYLVQMRSTIQAVGRLPLEPPPAELREELLRRFASMRPDRKD
jgi:predicted anti-sigma-YlaC factor YlaD